MSIQTDNPVEQAEELSDAELKMLELLDLQRECVTSIARHEESLCLIKSILCDTEEELTKLSKELQK